MKKRLLIFVFTVGVLFGVIGIIAFGLSKNPGGRFSPPEGTRLQLEDQYKKHFDGPGRKLPSLASSSSVPSHVIDSSDPTRIAFSAPSTSDRPSIGEFGDRIPVNPKTQSFVLPNGQEIKLIGVAYSKGPQKFYGPNDPKRYDRRGKLVWHDPIDLEIIEDPESLNLPSEVQLGEYPETRFAFSCSDQENRPIRWHWLRVFDDETKRPLGGSTGSRDHKSLKIFELQTHVYNETPIRLSLPISYGETEEFLVDYKSNKPISIGSGDAELSVIHTQAGIQSGSSHRPGTSSWDMQRSFRFSKPTPKSRYKSFSVVKIWPEIQGYTLERYDPARTDWRQIYMNTFINPVSHREEEAHLAPKKWRRYPEIVCGIFELPRIPELPKAENLFDVPVGPVEFRYPGDLTQMISHATAMQWSQYPKSVPDTNFPMHFEEPNTTPADLLQELESLTGETYFIDQENHTISPPPAPLLERFGKWLKETLSRF